MHLPQTTYKQLRKQLQDPLWNLCFREYVYKRGEEDPRFAKAIWEICKVDPLFWVNVFVWTFDPRPASGPRAKIPMITYKFQDRGLLALLDAIANSEDILIEKSRDMGASWLLILTFTWAWMYRKLQTFLLVSRVEGYVDDKGNAKSLFWKIDFTLEHMPEWMRPRVKRTKMHILNRDTGSMIDGESTTGDVARGDRRTAIGLDEFAAVEQGHKVLKSTFPATDCRIFNSTHQGTGTAYYTHSRTAVKKLRMHWSDHPVKAVGLYTKRNGEFDFIDKDYWREIENKKEVARALDTSISQLGVSIEDSKLRSPWYAKQCIRCAHAVLVAQELDIDPMGSSYQYFPATTIEDYIRRYCRAPDHIGDILYDPDTLEPLGWREDSRGMFKLWMELDGRGMPLNKSRMAVGVDVSAGTGASNSAFSGIRVSSSEKVLEYANPHIRPETLGKLGVATCLWLSQATMIWEQNGPGRQFGDSVMETEFRAIYYRRDEEKVAAKMTNVPGWVPTRDNKLALLGDYRIALELQTMVNRSELALRDTLEYVFLPNQSVEHAQSASSVDPTGARANHGDRVIADALAWKISKRKPVTDGKHQEDEIPPNCFLSRRRQAHSKQGRETVWGIA